jgi:uncharacterized protein
MLAEPLNEPTLPPPAALAGPTQDERNWAMLAHLSALLTIGIAASTSGVGYVVALLVPLIMYLYFAERSRYVAYHALQATVFQALAGIAYVVLATLVGLSIAAAWIVAGLLTVVLIGVLLLPVALGFTLLGAAQLLLLPVVGVFYALRGAYLTAQGEPFAYPWIGAVVAQSLHQPV